MNREKLIMLRKFYHDSLFDDVMPFWLKNGMDLNFGGIRTCLDRDGTPFSPDKSVWFQGRATWTFARMYNYFDQNDPWLDSAKLIYSFLRSHCCDHDGRMFFTVTEDGRPLQKRRYFYSETFAVIAAAELYKSTADGAVLVAARSTYSMLLEFYRHPEMLVPKINPDTRQTQSMAVPMILLATTQSLREADPDPELDSLAALFTEDILKHFYLPEEGLLLENAGPAGERLDLPAGRLINPGHSLEAAWFILQESIQAGRSDWIDSALRIIDGTLARGWDDLYGGLYYFLDIEGKPAEQLEWDMKLWWPHCEALYAVMLAFAQTGNPRYEEWYDKLHTYTFCHFPDPLYGEWFGYLHRDGSPASMLKGSIWKGPFHIPRLHMHMIQLIDKMLQTELK